MNMKDDISTLTKLGSNTKYQYDEPTKDIIETFPNVATREYHITLKTEEFTSLCPKTGQPDFGVITVDYVPAYLCIESKSFKLYMFAFRNYRSFMESMTNKILDDLYEACSPVWMDVRGEYNLRGGIGIRVAARR